MLRKWLGELGVKTLFIEPGSPWENGYVESFNGKMRDELLNREIFFERGASLDRRLEKGVQHHPTTQLSRLPTTGTTSLAAIHPCYAARTNLTTGTISGGRSVIDITNDFINNNYISVIFTGSCLLRRSFLSARAAREGRCSPYTNRSYLSALNKSLARLSISFYGRVP
jgi:transposase InsO family protein